MSPGVSDGGGADRRHDLQAMKPPRVFRLLPAATLGLLAGTLGLLVSLLPLWLDLEEHVGLGLLFSLRGSRPAPEDVVVVSIDKASADALGELPADPVKWPRSLHARLTENLERAGVTVIAFDVFFVEPRAAEEDGRFADAMAHARNVVLAKYLARDTVPLDRPDGRGGRLNMERLTSPVPILAEAAVGSAPFPLPKLPVRLNQYWKFRSAAGEVPTLPVVALQVWGVEAYDDLVRLLAKVRPGGGVILPPDGRTLLAAGHTEGVVRTLRAMFKSEPGLGEAMLEAARTERIERPQLLQALIRMYQGPDSEYLNFYGPPRTVRTVPYHEVLADEATSDPRRLGLRGKAVFVGLSDYLRPEQKDGFHTVFSQAGVDISGAEVAATAFANLLNDQHVRPLGTLGHVIVIFAGGILVGGLCAVLTPGAAAVSALGLGVAYLALALSRFTVADTWYPITAPLLFEVPAAFVGAILWRYVDTNRERRQMRTIFSHYLPGTVIDELMRNTGGTALSGQTVYGICLATDAERYTSLAESMEPEELARFVNRYYAIVFEPIRRHGGTISDVVGDAALAIWASPAADAALRSRACHAACELSAAVDRFNRDATGFKVPTRIGLHSGQMVLGHVGAMDHYEYRAIGDIVNTAARIQELNKRFRSRILASDDVLMGLDDFFSRRLGTFVLAGKSKPLVIHELICRQDEATDRQRSVAALFAEGVAAYENRSWLEAVNAFDACLSEAGNDDAARFYLSACAECRARDPDEPWEPVFRMETK
jgi:adenylate cyclase